MPSMPLSFALLCLRFDATLDAPRRHYAAAKKMPLRHAMIHYALRHAIALL